MCADGIDWFAGAVKNLATLPDIILQTHQQLHAHLEKVALQLVEYHRFAIKAEKEAFMLLSQGGWLGLERHFNISQVIALLEVYETQGEAAMNDAIRDHFGAGNSALLVSMSEGWATIPYFRDRRAILRDAVAAHQAGQFTLTIPALLPFAEGLCAEILDSSETNVVRVVAKERKSREAEEWAQLFYDVVENVIYKSYVFREDPAPYLNRHGILHGRVFDYASEPNSIRVFLLIDAVADLWHAKQQALSS
jgi:hypothetical protein